MIILGVAVLILLAVLALPIIAALIYKIFYDRHLTDQISGKASKKWLSPIALAVIVFLAEIIIYISIGVLGAIPYINVEHSENSGTVFSAPEDKRNDAMTYTAEDIDGTLYQAFDGTEVTGYTIEKKQTDRFTYCIYRNDNSFDRMLPDYIIRLAYTGDQNAVTFYAKAEFIQGETTSARGVFNDGSDCYLAVINSQYDVNYSLYLYDSEEAEEENAFDSISILLEHNDT